MPGRAMRGAILLALVAVLIAVPIAAASTHTSKPKPAKPKIKTEEVGYFGNANTTRNLSVFVYSNVGPSAGNHVTVCLKGGRCEKAKGHNARLAWYQANFEISRELAMGDPVSFTAYASSALGHARVSVTKPLLCMHNSGSTPQT